MSNTQPKVRLNRITKRFGESEVLRGISLEVRESEFLAFVGPSGCGKSTLLRTIAGFETPDQGEVWIDGTLMNKRRPGERGVAMVFQNYALYPHMTAAENIGFGLRNLGIAKVEVMRRVRDVAELLQIQSLLDRRPGEMSGGQRQRVAIGRAIIHDPKVFLFDEPLSNLDAALRIQMRLELARLHQRYSAPMIYVTHDQVEAMTLADRIAVMNKGQLEQVGSPMELYHRPANTFVARFLGSPSMNLIQGELVAASSMTEAIIRIETGVTIRAAVDARALPPSSSVMVGIRPEHFQIQRSSPKTETPWRAQVHLVENLGSRNLIYLKPGTSSEWVAEANPAEIIPSRGEWLELGADPSHVHVFGPTGQALPPTEGDSLERPLHRAS